jgi:hypothetical protein
MTEQDITRHKTDIDKLSQSEMARLWRFTPTTSGHPYFTNKQLFEYFQTKYQKKGGMTPEVSKAIGW